jgi:eukaryotic-like serine/threonine-protein kinase
VMESALRPDMAEASALEASKYETVGKLGQGGGGQVLKVLDRDLRREVAMKMLLPQHREGGGIPEDVLLRFIKEAQATGQLEHPNIVPVHDLGVNGEGHIYFTLKYAQGDSLKEVIRGRRDDLFNDERRKFRDLFSPMQMVEVLIGICQGVAYAHSKGIIHRDLKPENVMLVPDGEADTGDPKYRAVVMDFGLAKERRAGPEMAKLTATGIVLGTPEFMSPEQIRGKPLDGRSDVYALGILAFELLTGQLPFAGKSAQETMIARLRGSPAKLRDLRAELPVKLEAVILRCLAIDPAERFQSMDELAYAFEAAVATGVLGRIFRR